MSASCQTYCERPFPPIPVCQPKLDTGGVIPSGYFSTSSAIVGISQWDCPSCQSCTILANVHLWTLSNIPIRSLVRPSYLPILPRLYNDKAPVSSVATTNRPPGTCRCRRNGRFAQKYRNGKSLGLLSPLVVAFILYHIQGFCQALSGTLLTPLPHPPHLRHDPGAVPVAPVAVPVHRGAGGGVGEGHVSRTISISL